MTATVLEPVTILEPRTLGPTWQRNPDWDGRSRAAEFVLPERTLGWQVIEWCEENLLNDEGEPWSFTREQIRFVLWWYAVDDRGRFTYRKGVLQRLKGWGKDPVAACLSAVELVGPSRFSRWADEEDVEAGIAAEVGEPIGARHPRAWVQIAAVSRDQTRNTMTLFPALFTKECIAEHRIDIGKEIIYAYNGACRLEAVTSSPRALEGGRPTFVVKNETHHWLLNNSGHAMSDVIDRNATKSKGGASRTLSITNAYEPSEDSVAQREREAWEDQEAGLAIDTHVMYDSLEMPDGTLMRPKRLPGQPEPSDEQVKAYLSAVVTAIRGDADWLDVENIVNAILDPVNPPSLSRRFWFNMIVAGEDQWAMPEAVDAAADPLSVENRRLNPDDILRAGWLVLPEDEIAVFFDGSKSGDDTGLVGCRIRDGHVFTLGHWHKPAGQLGKGWQVPRHEVDNRVREVHERFNVVAMFADPSHAQDEDSGRYWDGIIDGWHREYKEQYQVWAVRTGDRQHSVMWDMTSPQRSAEFTGAAETFVEELEHIDELETRAPTFTHDGHPALMRHLKNAKRYPNQWGTSLWKGHREASKKIDLAVCAVGARMLRRLVLNKGLEDAEKAGQVWW